MSKTPSVGQLLDDLRAAIEQSPLSKKDIAEAAGLHINTMLRFNDPNWDPHISTIAALERVILITPPEGPLRKRKRSRIRSSVVAQS